MPQIIKALAFSKDRAMQLDLLLRSIRDHWPEIMPESVLYLYSNDDFRDGYEKIKAKFRDVKFFHESNIQADVLKIVNEIDEPYFVMLCDDAIAVRNPSADLSVAFEYFDNDIIGIVLHTDKNVKGTWDFKKDSIDNLAPYEIPEFIETNKHFCKWDWTKLKERKGFSYPHAVGTIIYKTKYMQQILNSLKFKNAPQLEGGMARNLDYGKPYMMCLSKISVVGIPNNRTQIVTNTPCDDNEEYSLVNLNKKYLEGYIIDTKNLYETDFVRPHQLAEYKLIKESL